jgi:hypothetical protein
MSRDQEGLSPVLPKDRGVKEKKELKMAGKTRKGIHIHFLRLRSCPQGRRTPEKPYSSLASEWEIGVGAHGAHPDSAEGLSRGV